MRRLVSALVVAMVVCSTGCGGNVEKNKNKDLDRPKPASEK
jgi:hypothetical protein